MTKKIAFFDFDGTITTKDTMLELVRFHHGKARFYLGMMAISPYLVMMKAGIITNQAAKEKMLAYFFGGIKLEIFNDLCRRFAAEVIPSLIRPAALVAIGKLKAEGTEVVIVSASAENWINQWCDALGLSLIASVLEVKEGRITGRLIGQNCHGDEKVTRIRSNYDLAGYSFISCYGDTSGDKPMLSLASEAHYKPFRD